VSKLLYDFSQSVSQSFLALNPSGIHQILAVAKTVAVRVSWGVYPHGRMGLSLSDHSLYRFWYYA
jgi:hypothetical protein